MKIAYLVGSLGYGGAERQLYYFLKIMSSEGNELTVIALNEKGFWEAPIRKLGINVINIKKSPYRLYRLYRIIFHLKKLTPDIIHSQSFYANIYAVLAGFLLRKRAIGSIRNNVISEISRIPKLGNLCLKLPNKLVVNSFAAIVNAKALGKKSEHLFFIPNVVDGDYFLPSNKELKTNQLKVVFVGTFKAAKKVDRIIRVAEICMIQKLNISFYVYGKGEQKDFLMKLAKDVNVLNNKLFFMGEIMDPRIAYNFGDVFLLTSVNEGMPNVILESMACGLPIVSTDIGDVRSIIKNNVNGYLIESPYSDSKVVEALLSLYENPSLRLEMGMNNRKLITEEYSIQNLKPLLNQLYTH